METLEQAIARMINEKLSDGTVERIISAKLEKAVSDALEDVFGWNGTARKEITSRFNSVMVPVIEAHDFNKYIVKLDTVLTDIVNNTNLTENKRILENFQTLLKDPECKEIKLSEIFKKYCDHIAKNVDTDNLEVYTDDRPCYQCVNATMSVEDTRGRYFSYKEYTITLECKEDEKLKKKFRLISWMDDKKWNIRDVADDVDINSLRYLSDFEVFLITLRRASVSVIIDTNGEREEVEPDAEPEPEWR